jgi:hypothetical protein
VELSNAVFTVDANRPRLSEVVWALHCDYHAVHMLIVGAREVGRAGEGKDEFIRIRAFGWRFKPWLVSHRAEMSHSHAWSVGAVNRNHLRVLRAVDGLFESGVVRYQPERSAEGLAVGIGGCPIANQRLQAVEARTFLSLPGTSGKRSRKQNSRDYDPQALRIFQRRSPPVFRIVCQTMTAV